MLRGSSGVDDHENEGADGGRGEQQGAVLADLAGLDGLQRAAGAAGALAGAVDRSVDHALVDVAVHPAADLAAADAGAVDDAVDDVLVDPVRGLGDRVGDRRGR